MSATKQTLYEQIVALRQLIDEATINGTDTTSLNKELQELNSKWMNLCEAEQKNSNVLKG